MGNRLIIAVFLNGSVPDSKTVSKIAHTNVKGRRFVCLFFGWQLLDLQMVVQRIFPHSAVKFRPVHFLIEQRILCIKKPYLFIIKGKDFVFVSADIYRIAEMIGILRLLLRLAFSRLHRFLFKRSRG